jgi:hypothetical protein
VLKVAPKKKTNGSSGFNPGQCYFHLSEMKGLSAELLYTAQTSPSIWSAAFFRAGHRLRETAAALLY